MNKYTFYIVLSDQQDGTKEEVLTAIHDSLLDVDLEVTEIREVSEPLER